MFRVPGFIDVPAKMLANFIQFLLSSSATSEFYIKVCVTSYCK